MNDKRRKAIAAIAEQLSTLQEQIAELRDQEQEAFDAMPESLQGSDRGQAMQEAIDTLDTAASDAENVRDNLQGMN